MADEGFKRKLAAILSADVEGYSRLMDDDEEATVRTLTAYRTAIADLVDKFRGRIVDTPGDNILAEFTSVVDAVSCAVEIQQELAERNADLPDERKMQFRIGVNLGDVIDEEERIYGDGVNIAARIESLSEAGGVCISHSAYDQIKNKLNFGYEYLGEHKVKNIRESVKAYRVLVAPEFEGKLIGFDKKASNKRWIWVAAAAVVAAVVGLGIWQYYLRRPFVEPASEEKMAFPLPEKPSVVVLPFVNMTGDPNKDYLADAISDNITTALAAIPDIFVIDRNSALSFKQESVQVKQVAEELGIQYVVEGSLQKAEEGFQLTTRVVDAIAGRNLWAKRFKKDLNDIFETQDEIAINILKAIHAKSTHGSDVVFNLGTKSVEARNYFAKGKDHYSIYDCKKMGKAIVLYKKALEIDPGYAAAWASLAQVYHAVSNKGYACGILPTEARKLRTDCLTKALEIDSTASGAHMLLAEIYQQDGQYEMAVKQLEDAIEKNPNSAELHFKLGELLGEGGRPKQAIALIEKAMRLNPFYPWYYLGTLSRSYFLFEQYNDGLKIAEQLLDRGQKEVDKQVITSGHWWCAVNLVELGQIEQAQAHMKEYLSLLPGANANVFEGLYKDRFQNPEDLERICTAINKAGLRWYR